VVVNEFGGPGTFTLIETADPTAEAGQALVKVAVPGVNFIDVDQRAGLYPMPTPFPAALAAMLRCLLFKRTLEYHGGSAMQALMIINGSAYGLDSTYNAIRLAAALAKRDGVDMTVFLMGDGVGAAMKGQKTPDGYYKLDRMLTVVSRNGGAVLCCGTCMDARGITEDMLMEGAQRSTMEALADNVLGADKVLVF